MLTPGDETIDPTVLRELPADVRAEVLREARAPPTKKAKKYHQAKERDGQCEILCFRCRRTPGKAAQASLTKFFGGGAPRATVCARCRVPLEAKKPEARPLPMVPPQVTRLKSYRRLADQAVVPFALTDGEALAVMREPCFGCGAAAGEGGNGLSRLRNWFGLEARRADALKSFMGPFSRANVVAACATCNRMKGARTVASFVEACRTIATHRSDRDFGSYPERFRDNVSRRSRSAYITLSSTHTKTHALTNHQFNNIVKNPCHYCGKPHKPPGHFNGLDRLDSDDRVYAQHSVVACCGDCNIMKYKHSENFFIDHCVKVATHHLGVVFDQDPADDDDDDGRDGEDDDRPDDDL
ncbi:hypothetical protein CTAYLR_004515 [Chrysophaeum taylorii]|uniref:Uncharacterized protein n=1 Tax=Chrysophaeum taylorii TaxID=2483200 RepID=A0AAD7UPI4_9STRA|nr:hypothetical protein CTAYLR_004515 [Chrysophaeum taylorii]